jgi:SAM-dependent methyltransferase
MCTPSCISFVQGHLTTEEVFGKSVLEVGALDVNGTVRPVIEALGPASYIGVDIEPGPNVDELCDVALLTARYGEDSFDLVVSTELVEHVRDWRAAFTNMKLALRPSGTIIVTTRSRGFPIHGYPSDYWRYEPEDMERIFADFEIVVIERDREVPGVFVKARKPAASGEGTVLADIALYSVVAGRRTVDISPRSDRLFRLGLLLSAKAPSWTQPLRNKLKLRTRLRRWKHRRSE